MRILSLRHFNHSSLGKTTHGKRIGYMNINYITREAACSKTLSEHMPADQETARNFFEHLVARSKNPNTARIADKLIIALPLELTKEQHYDLVRRLMKHFGKGRIPWIAGFHDIGKDAHNPHVHITFRDADIETGRKVLGTTTSAKDVKEAQEKGWAVPPRTTTKDMRVFWCDLLNREMQRLGIDVRFDHRRLAEQGIDRKPGKHLSPQAYQQAKANNELDGQQPVRDKTATKPAPAATADKKIDSTKKPPSSSLEEHKQRTELSRRQRQERDAMRQDQKLDRAALREAHKGEKLEHAKWGRALYAPARAKAYAATGKDFVERWRNARKTKGREQRDNAFVQVRADQKKAYEEAAAIAVEKLRPQKNAAWLALMGTQETDRRVMKKQHGSELSLLSRQHIAERYAMTERWQQTHLNKQAVRISAKFETSQSMPIVQAHAVKMIKLRHKQDRGANTGSDEAIQYYADAARAQAEQRHALRATLTAEREANQQRGTSTLERAAAAPAKTANAAGQDKGLDVKRQQQKPNEKANDTRTARKTNPPVSSSAQAHAPSDGAPKPAPKSTQRQRDNDLLRDWTQRQNDKDKDKGRDGGRSGR